MSEAEVSVLDIVEFRPLSVRAVAAGEIRPTMHDPEQRVPTLHERIRCRLPDESEIGTTRIDCVQRQGSPVR
jgi:hypothetical protein